MKTCCALIVMTALAAMPCRAAIFYPTSFTLANGLQVVVVPNHSAPVVSQMVWYKVGAADEVKGKNGLAHYLEHLMFRGTTNIPAGEFSKIIAAQGGEENAFTSYDYTAYFEEVAADRLPLIMHMEADRMQNLRVKPETAAPELQVVLDERQQRTDNDPSGRFIEKLDRKFLPHYPYGRPVIGWKREIEKLTAQDAQDFYALHYAPNNAVVVISGDVSVEEVMSLAAATYGQIPHREVAERKLFSVPPLPAGSDFTEHDAGIEQPEIIWRLSAPAYATRADDLPYAYEILAEILVDGEVGLLYQKLVSEQGLASQVETSYDPDARGETSFTIAASPRPGQSTQKVQQALRETLRQLADKGIDDVTIAAAKKRLQNAAIFARDSLMTPGYVFGSALTTGHTVADVEVWPDRINGVTTAQVNQALRELAATPRQIMGVLLPDPHATAAQREAAHPVLNSGAGIR